MNHWDTQAVHLSIEGSLYFVPNIVLSSFYYLSSYFGIRQLYSCPILYLEIANSNFPLFYSSTFPRLSISRSDSSLFVFSVGARKLSMTGSIRNFENKNFT